MEKCTYYTLTHLLSKNLGAEEGGASFSTLFWKPPDSGVLLGMRPVGVVKVSDGPGKNSGQLSSV